DLFPNLSMGEIEQEYSFTDGNGTRYAVPQLAFLTDPSAEPASDPQHPATINLGNRVFLRTSTQDTFGYMRQVLAAYENMLALHDQLKAQYAGNLGAYYDAMFITNPDNRWDSTYTVKFDDTWAHGGHGGISVYRPDRMRFAADGGVDRVTWLLSDTSVLSHEFGHSVHGGFAPASLVYDYNYGDPL